MWCDTCQAEVAAIASSEHDRLQCTCCGSMLERAGRSPPAEPARHLHPRELLARWSQEDSLPPLQFGSATAQRAMPPRQKPETPAPALRFDAPHGETAVPRPLLEPEFPHDQTPAPQPAATDSAPLAGGTFTLHRRHAELPDPHFLPAEMRAPDRSPRWMTLVGQILAYAGVGGLTVGTVLVLMGYFGAAGGHMGTGWLVAACGQMMLFLGVITLVSSGMEQTTHEVARRIDTLGQRLVRIEQAAWHDPPNDRTASGRRQQSP